MNAYLFAWNPGKWNWIEFEQKIDELQNTGKTTEKWSCVSYKKIKQGDRAFLTKVGSDPKGIIGAGYVISEPSLSPHWNAEDKSVYLVNIQFHVLLNPEKEPILTNDILATEGMSRQHWIPQSSGIAIKGEVINELEAVWSGFLKKHKIYLDFYDPTESTAQQSLIEGTAVQVVQTRYERNPVAREKCLKHYGYKCAVCEFIFSDYYGSIGKDFIHVHHLTQIATVKKAYSVDPIVDLRPVCPNCHAMLHKRVPALTIDELKSLR